MDDHVSCNTSILRTDDEILQSTLSSNPEVVAIDAPLFLPYGRPSLEIRGPPHFRKCDLELRRMGIRFFPISLGPMRMLTKRGMAIRKALEQEGLKVFETYPGAIQDILGMPRKQKGLAQLRGALVAYGVVGSVSRDGISGDELDAVTCSIMGILYLNDSYLAIGDEREGFMILPQRNR
jgi:predicted nuclease with RNAse H fold